MKIMRMLSMTICLLLAISMNANKSPTAINFFDGDFESAKVKAGSEGKLFFVDFYANWCTPCKWMEETTFNDTEVLGLLEENYVSLKIDIDELDGYSVKQKFQVSILPTMLIFNSKGELIARVEETLSSRKLAKLLSYHNKEENKIRVKHAVNSSPELSVSRSISKSVRTSAPKSVVHTTKAGKQKFRIQLGVFNKYENTYELVGELKKKFIEPVIVLHDFQDGVMLYKVMMGEFETKEEAHGFKVILNDDFNLAGLVK